MANLTPPIGSRLAHGFVRESRPDTSSTPIRRPLTQFHMPITAMSSSTEDGDSLLPDLAAARVFTSGLETPSFKPEIPVDLTSTALLSTRMHCMLLVVGSSQQTLQELRTFQCIRSTFQSGHQRDQGDVLLAKPVFQHQQHWYLPFLAAEPMRIMSNLPPQQSKARDPPQLHMNLPLCIKLMSIEFGFKKDRFVKNFPDLYSSPEKPAQPPMASSDDEVLGDILIQAVDRSADDSSNPHETSPQPQAALPSQETTSNATTSSNRNTPIPTIESSDITVTIEFRCSDTQTEAATIKAWRPISRDIKSRASEKDFSEMLREALREKLTSEQQLIDRLQLSEQEVHMYPAITFNDWRDLYLTPDVRGTFKFEVVEDLFVRPFDPKAILVIVDVAIRKLHSEADTFLKPNCDQFLPLGWGPTQEPSYYRIPNGKALTGARTTHLVRFNNGMLKPLTVESWLVSERLLGDVETGKVLNDFEPPMKPFPHFGQPNAASLKDAVKNKIEKLEKTSTLGVSDRNVPGVPKLSFQPYASNNLGPLSAVDRVIPTAIRFVNRLSQNQSLDIPTTEWFPYYSHFDPARVCTLLRNLLNKDTESNSNQSYTLFSRDECDKWNIDLWVMPQDDGERKMRFWWCGSLAQFLSDADDWKDDLRLYMEAHIVPVTTQHCQSEISQSAQKASLHSPVATSEAGSSGSCNAEDAKSSEGPSASSDAEAVSEDPEPDETIFNHNDSGDEEDEKLPNYLSWVEPDSGPRGCSGHIRTTFSFPKERYQFPVQELPVQQSVISLDKPLSDLPEIVDSHFQAASRPHAAYVSDFQQRGGKVVLDMGISFKKDNSGRNHYVNAKELERCRIKHFRDLFRSHHDVKVGAVVPAHAKIELFLGSGASKTSSQAQNSSQTQEQADSGIRYHRYGTISLSQGNTNQSRHSPMNLALLARYDPADPSTWRPVQVPYRKVNGTLIGTLSEKEESSHQEPFQPGTRLVKKYQGVPQHRSADAIGYPLEVYINWVLKQAVQHRFSERNVPKLPNLSFIQFNSDSRIPSQGDAEKIYLAFRIENRLHELGLEDVAVPRDVLMTVNAFALASQTFPLIDGTLQARLEHYAATTDHKIRSGKHPSRLFHEDTKGKWKIIYWVMPQASTMQKLRPYRKGEVKLEQFLDKHMVKKGDTRLDFTVEAETWYRLRLGNTIKRWLATSPRPNAEQTDEMTEPETPVRLIQDETLQSNGLDGRSNAPRKKSITIRLSSSRSASIPSSSSNEPQTPSHSPKIIFQSSIDGRIFAEADDADDTIDKVDPSIKDPVRISVHVSCNGMIYVHRAVISLDCPREGLTTAIARLCADWRASQAEYLQFLQTHGKCVHMVANIHFGDHRDLYVSGNEQGCHRFETLRDFFDSEELHFLESTGKLPMIGVIVTVQAENMPEGGGVSEYPSPTTTQWSHHRVGGWTIADKTENSQHSPLSIGLYAPYDRATGHMHAKLIEIREREINNLLIDSFTNPLKHDHITTPSHLEPQYIGLTSANHKVHKLIKRNVLFNAKFHRPEQNVAILPMMTFNEFTRPEGAAHTDSISNDPIHLAVRLVNALPPNLQHIHLPTNILLTVHPGKGTKSAIITTLTSTLQAYGKKFLFDHLGIGQLFKPKMHEDGVVRDVWNEHRLDLWVLPQKGHGRMHLFERGSLKWFLDAEMAAEGDRRLYVEAWILPGVERELWEVVSEGEDE
ncbi:hypothetical protein M409DRAFT_58550 [Zasmidium cellare ATCC 36951]|uniref:Uncharacterized protein n=1 Tax=Zasmidium cellare ATCC 36951 TaxID=1080233 RepID=A0A6A6C4P6_ZASCE|nr:uncharacterized protein M409DRAFT_58550 [Zasmidium cellare ATCC 36951]KAF2162104.1 hypothetical protein M409DRAFT_58550 [Zasmidium cellare ATCC 36951]